MMNIRRPDWVTALAVALGMLIAFGCAPPSGSRDMADWNTDSDGWQLERERMVDTQLRARDITNESVLAAMARVPRHRFVPPAQQPAAYGDHAVPIGHGQTISQPYVVAYMTQALEISAGQRVLEIGTGSGYQAAVLAELVAQVYTIEIIPELAAQARAVLTELGYQNVHVRAGDGYQGWPEEAPFDRIMVTAAAPRVPPALVDQLAVGGKMAIPVGTWNQELLILTKTPEGIQEQRTLPVRFVPMTGGPR